MKRTLLILSAFLISMTVFGQKDQVKAAKKAIDAGNFAAATSSLNQAESLISSADQKTAAQYYHLKVLSLYKNGKGADVEKINDACNDLIKYEKGTKVKYTPEIKELKQSLVVSTSAKASESYKLASQTNSPEEYAKAAKGFHMVYLLSPKDTLQLDNAALIYNRAKDYEASIALYEELLALNYTGISTSYIASDKEGKDVVYATAKDMNLQVKLGLASNPRTEVNPSRRNIIYKYLADNYVELEDLDMALETIAKGRAEFPKSYELLITEANIYFKKDDNEKFKTLLEEAISIKPNDPNLYYNVGVMNLQQKDTDAAISNFNKAIELKPDFTAAYQNIGTAIIDKTIPIVDEMNNSLSDFDKYDKLKAQQIEIYKEALPYYEKAYELENTNIGVVQTLLSLYENIGMEEELEKIKVVYDELNK